MHLLFNIMFFFCFFYSGTVFFIMKYSLIFTFTFSHLADAFIQSDLQMRTIEAIKTNKRAMIRKCYNKAQLA